MRSGASASASSQSSPASGRSALALAYSAVTRSAKAARPALRPRPGRVWSRRRAPPARRDGDVADLAATAGSAAAGSSATTTRSPYSCVTPPLRAVTVAALSAAPRCPRGGRGTVRGSRDLRPCSLPSASSCQPSDGGGSGGVNPGASHAAPSPGRSLPASAPVRSDHAPANSFSASVSAPGSSGDSPAAKTAATPSIAAAPPAPCREALRRPRAAVRPPASPGPSA